MTSAGGLSSFNAHLHHRAGFILPVRERTERTYENRLEKCLEGLTIMIANHDEACPSPEWCISRLSIGGSASRRVSRRNC